MSTPQTSLAPRGCWSEIKPWESGLGEEEPEQTGHGAVCAGQNDQKEVKYGRYRVTSTFAGTENLTDLLECYIDRVGSLRYGA